MSEIKPAVRCTECKKIVVLPIPKEKLVHWIANKRELPLIQDYFPELSIAEREILISGYCGDCFDAIMKPVLNHG